MVQNETEKATEMTLDHREICPIVDWLQAAAAAKGATCNLTDHLSPASTGNRTRAARVAGEHSTTEPSMLYRSRTAHG